MHDIDPATDANDRTGMGLNIVNNLNILYY
jgi:hypothetical protein